MSKMRIALFVLGVGFVAFAVWAWTPDKSWKELEADYLRGPQDLAQVSGVQLHVRDDGPDDTLRDAPSVIMIHGFGSSLHTWEPWAQTLNDRYRVVRFDMPGAGLSPPDPMDDYSDERVIALILALMDQRGIERASFIGNSLGGRIAWRFAASHPSRTDKLILVSPDGFASPGFEYGKAPAVSPILEVMRVALPRAIMKMNVAPSYADPANLTREVMDRYHDLMLAPGARGAMLARMRQTVLTPPEPYLRKIDAPVLLVWGEKDAMIPLANAADYQAVLPHSRLITFKTLGHVPHEEDPETSIGPILDFLSAAP